MEVYKVKEYAVKFVAILVICVFVLGNSMVYATSKSSLNNDLRQNSSIASSNSLNVCAFTILSVFINILLPLIITYQVFLLL